MFSWISSSSFSCDRSENGGRHLFQGLCEHGLYSLPLLPRPIAFIMKPPQQLVGTRGSNIHPPKLFTKNIQSFNLPTNYVQSNSTHCQSCLINKSHKLPFHKHGLMSYAPFDLIYTDVWGPSPTPSLNGHWFYVIFVDHFTKYVWFFPLHRKSDVQPIFCHFYKMIHIRFNLNII